MARVAVLSADLMFGSRVQASLSAAGAQVELLATEALVRERLADASLRPEALLVDLTDPDLDGIAALIALRSDGLLDATATLAYYSHVDADVRRRALEASFDLVVPRSRMAREAPQLLASLTGG